MRQRSVAFLAAALAAGVLMAGASAADPPAPTLAAPATADPVPDLMKSAPDVARGRSMFLGTCGAYCHKMVPAQTDAAYLFGCDWRHGGSDAEIFHTITHGVPGSRMVAFGGAIPDADIWRIIAYLKTASKCGKPGS